ncbi:uncharacterized protein PFL1_02765 [Pseudozyma flocculosa PF-1]|uniref:Uncharacterized protein n=1 Tax=Pseudozyma flocculosa PF-1 TaxID=1277687 RepID=A0A061HG13_9BASI|nr:uncharacterized protein PFL1_02765 [Pseudozyma flocculosa PF-1]EPQ29546.1 hypothetical protein PFL1_02765 [Pseudozyma flocculosa PF-1]
MRLSIFIVYTLLLGLPAYAQPRPPPGLATLEHALQHDAAEELPRLDLSGVENWLVDPLQQGDESNGHAALDHAGQAPDGPHTSYATHSDPVMASSSQPAADRPYHTGQGMVPYAPAAFEGSSWSVQPARDPGASGHELAEGHGGTSSATGSAQPAEADDGIAYPFTKAQVHRDFDLAGPSSRIFRTQLATPLQRTVFLERYKERLRPALEAFPAYRSVVDNLRFAAVMPVAVRRRLFGRVRESYMLYGHYHIAHRQLEMPFEIGDYVFYVLIKRARPASEPGSLLVPVVAFERGLPSRGMHRQFYLGEIQMPSGLISLFKLLP